MTVLLEQRGGIGQVRSRLLGGAIGGLAGKDGVVLEQLDGKDLAACVGRAKHVSDIAAVAVCRLKNKRHKPSLGVVLSAGVDRHGGVERVETDEFIAVDDIHENAPVNTNKAGSSRRGERKGNDLTRHDRYCQRLFSQGYDKEGSIRSQLKNVTICNDCGGRGL